MKKNIKTYDFKIEGMTCSACANRVERVTKKLEGVESSTVNFATEKLTIKVDEDEISYGDIKVTVDKAGYKLVKEEDKVEEKQRKEKR